MIARSVGRIFAVILPVLFVVGFIRVTSGNTFLPSSSEFIAELSTFPNFKRAVTDYFTAINWDLSTPNPDASVAVFDGALSRWLGQNWFGQVGFNISCLLAGIVNFLSFPIAVILWVFKVLLGIPGSMGGVFTASMHSLAARMSLSPLGF